MRPSRVEVLAGAWLLVTVAIAALAPILARVGPLQPVTAPLAAPSIDWPLGADALGRDLWARFVFGARLSLGASFLAAGVTVLSGSVAGMMAAVLGGWADRSILWAANALLAIPGLLLAMLLVAAFGPGLPTVVIAVGLGGAPGFARLARTVFQQAQQGGYVQAARALGAGRRWIATHHLVPNALPQITSLATVQYAWSFLAMTTLTFLGFSGDPSTPEWGAMLNAGRAHLVDAPRLALVPGLAISLTIMAVHALGAWLARGRSPSAPAG